MTNIRITKKGVEISVNNNPGCHITNSEGLSVELVAGSLKVNGNIIYDDLKQGDKLSVDYKGVVIREYGYGVNSIDAFIEQTNKFNLDKVRCHIL